MYELAVGVPAYFAVMGVSYKVHLRVAFYECEKCELRDGKYVHIVEHAHYNGDRDKLIPSTYTHGFAAWWSSVLWPLVLPYTLGKVLDKEVRRDKKRREELLAAQHQVNLARIRAEEDRILDNRLRELEHGSDDHPRS